MRADEARSARDENFQVWLSRLGGVCGCEATIQPYHIGKEPFFGVSFPDIRLAALGECLFQRFVTKKPRQAGCESGIVVRCGGDPALANLERSALVADPLIDPAEELDDA